MPFVLTQGALTQVSRSPMTYSMPLGGNSVTLADGIAQDYAAIWRTQPQIRTVVSFLARNIAQLGLHVFRRLSDVDRERLNDHPLAVLIGRPNPHTTTYRWIEQLVSDLALYDNAIHVKITSNDQPYAVVRLDPRGVQPLGDNPYAPEVYRLWGNRGTRDIPADQVVHWRGYNPDDARWGTSAIETLRRILVEEYQAGQYREQLWRNGARMSGYIERPLDAPEWSSGDKRRFRSQWRAQYTGDGPQAGGTPILEDGMKWVASGVTPEAAQYIEARKLTREEVAAAYHIPLPMVQILEHATYSNITEQHKQLYQDTLGPWLTMLTQEIHLQLLPDFTDSTGVYCEFNLAEKLRGSFEEQAKQLQAAVGAPWMTRNEARGLSNLRQVPGGDDLVTPLNVLVGQAPAPEETAPGAEQAAGRRSTKLRATVAKARPDGHEQQAERVFAAHFGRQARVVITALGGGKARGKAGVDDVFDAERWIGELSADLFRLHMVIATAAGRATLAQLGLDPDDYDEPRTHNWHAVAAKNVATSITTLTGLRLADALADDDPREAVKGLFGTYATSRAAQLAVSTVTDMSGFGSTEAGHQIGRDDATKTWLTTSAKPRPEHAALSGETVPLDGEFSNGAKWPGDSLLDENDRAGCQCDMEITFP